MRHPIWYAANPNNYSFADRPNTNSINKIIIHVTHCSFESTIGRFQASSARVSAHYTIRFSDGFVAQSVQEKDIAWHAGNWPYNQTSIGIEHEGYVSDPKWFTEAMYVSSAKLSAYLVNKYDIPIDREHIIGHDEVPDPNNPDQRGGVDHHQDPGPHFDWDKYMDYIRIYAS